MIGPSTPVCNESPRHCCPLSYVDARLTWLCPSPQEAMLTMPAFQRSVQGCLSPPLAVRVPSIPLLVLVFFCWATSSRQLRNLVPLPVSLWGCLSLLVGPLTSHGRLPPYMGSLLTFPGLPCPALGCLRGDALLSPPGSDFLCWAATRVVPSSPHSRARPSLCGDAILILLRLFTLMWLPALLCST